MSYLSTVINFSESEGLIGTYFCSKDSENGQLLPQHEKSILELSIWWEKMRPAYQRWELWVMVHVQKRIQAWLRKASWLVRWKEMNRVCILNTQGVYLMVPLFLFPSLRRLVSNHLSQNSTDLQIHLRIAGFSSVFLRLKKDQCSFEKEIISNYFILIPWEIRFLKILQLYLYLCDPSALTTKSRNYELCACQTS